MAQSIQFATCFSWNTEKLLPHLYSEVLNATQLHAPL